MRSTNPDAWSWSTVACVPSAPEYGMNAVIGFMRVSCLFGVPVSCVLRYASFIRFFPNLRTFTSAATRKPGMVDSTTHRKKCWYPIDPQPAAEHTRNHHAEGHEAGADGIVRGLVLPFRGEDHEQHIGGEPEPVA